MTKHYIDTIDHYSKIIYIHDNNILRQMALVKLILDQYSFPLIVVSNDNEQKQFTDLSIDAFYVQNFVSTLSYIDPIDLFANKSMSIMIIYNLTNDIYMSHPFQKILNNYKGMNLVLCILDMDNRILTTFKKHIDEILFPKITGDDMIKTYHAFFETYPIIDNFVDQLMNTEDDEYMIYKKNTISYSTSINRYAWIRNKEYQFVYEKRLSLITEDDIVVEIEID